MYQQTRGRHFTFVMIIIINSAFVTHQPFSLHIIYYSCSCDIWDKKNIDLVTQIHKGLLGLYMNARYSTYNQIQN